jgi:hypothetical protein
LLATANFTKKSAAKKRIWDAFLFKIRWAPTFYFEKFDKKYESLCSVRQRRAWSLKTIHSWQLQTTTAAATLTLPLSHNHDLHHRTDNHFSLLPIRFLNCQRALTCSRTAR